MRSFSIKRLAAATFVGGALTLAPVAMPAANAAPPTACPKYQGAVTTQTTVSISPANPSKGETFTATATVTTDDAPATGGTVKFTYRGDSATKTVVAGKASTTFTATGNGAVVAKYSGVCPSGAGVTVLGSSRGTASILGVEASAGGNGGIAGISGGSGGSGGIAGLAATGMDTQTQLFGLLGVGMVTVGGLSLMVHRRRTQS